MEMNQSITLCVKKSQPVQFVHKEDAEKFMENNKTVYEILAEKNYKRPYFQKTITLGHKPTNDEIDERMQDPIKQLSKFIDDRFHGNELESNGIKIRGFRGQFYVEKTKSYMVVMRYIFTGTVLEDFTKLRKHCPKGFDTDCYKSRQPLLCLAPMKDYDFCDRFVQAQDGDCIEWMLSTNPKREEAYYVTVEDDNEAADIIISKYGNILKKCGSRIFIFSEGVWTETYDKPLRALILGTEIMKITKDGPRPYAGNTSGANAIMSAVLSKLPNEPAFVDNLWHANLGKIFYQNGYYDFDEAEFYESLDPDKSSTTFRIPWDFPERDEEAEQLVLDKVFMPIFNKKEVLDNYFALIARGLAGRIEDKNWNAVRGFRNSGKGVKTDALTYAFPKYVVGFNADSLMTNKNSATQDVAKSLSSFAKCEWARIAISQEIVNDGRTINGNIIKGKLASGGDIVEVRTNYKDEMQIRFQTLFELNFNDIGKFNTPDCLSTLNQFVLQSVFSDNPVGDMKQADITLKEKLRTPKYIAGLTHLLLRAYKKEKPKQCEDVKEWTQSLMEDNGNADVVIKESFIITRDKKDVLLNTHLKRWIETSRIEMSVDKLGDHLIFLGAKADKNLSIDGKTRGYLRGYIGVKLPVPVPVPSKAAETCHM